MRGEKRKPKARTATVADAGSTQHMSYRRSREQARRLMRRGVFNKRIVEDAQQKKRGRG